MSEETSNGAPPSKRKRTTPVIPKTPLEAQKIQLEKLMADPNKEVVIPELRKDQQYPEPPEFMRFYMGSSAGAGSEVFHIYRHLRRKETLRQNYIREEAEKEEKEEEFQMKLAANKAKSEGSTAKKRAKRLKKKQNKKEARIVVQSSGDPSASYSSHKLEQEVEEQQQEVEEQQQEVDAKQQQEVDAKQQQEVDAKQQQEVEEQQQQEVDEEREQKVDKEAKSK
jgi:DNA polymerase III alpha subunit (gram-positive type)